MCSHLSQSLERWLGIREAAVVTELVPCITACMVLLDPYPTLDVAPQEGVVLCDVAVEEFRVCREGFCVVDAVAWLEYSHSFPCMVESRQAAASERARVRRRESTSLCSNVNALVTIEDRDSPGVSRRRGTSAERVKFYALAGRRGGIGGRSDQVFGRIAEEWAYETQVDMRKVGFSLASLPLPLSLFPIGGSPRPP